MTKVQIIAEAGVNHNGDLKMALQLVEVAAKSGADVIKFQTFKAAKLVSKEAVKAAYQKENLVSSDESQLAMLKKLELPNEWHETLKQKATELGIQFASTGFDEESIRFLHELGQPFLKIPSGEITNKPLLEYIARLGNNVIMSTGMATMEEIRESIEVMLLHGLSKEKLTVLHCNTEYPTPMKDVNLRAMEAIRRDLGVAVGYSDHTMGIEVPIAAVALGAQVIEKHITLDRNLPGPDHKASLEPHELHDMVQAIRNIELALSGSGKKEPSPSEMKNMTVARKSIHISRELVKNTEIKAEDLVMKRPGNGISPMRINEVIGRTLTRKMLEGEQLSWEDLH
jgi:N-acetylneuraminate synthase/N,N'-diacetyllegionaminate synthase